MADFTACHTLVIQKHYEFYLANKIFQKSLSHKYGYSHVMSLCLFAATAFALTIPLALCANVIAEHGAEDKILFWRQHVQRSVYHQAYGIKTFFFPEKQVYAIITHRQYDVAYVLALQA